MDVFRSEKNPIITPEDVKSSRPDFKIVGVFNCGVTRLNGEILLLMRVADTSIAYAEVKLSDILCQLK